MILYFYVKLVRFICFASQRENYFKHECLRELLYLLFAAETVIGSILFGAKHHWF